MKALLLCAVSATALISTAASADPKANERADPTASRESADARATPAYAAPAADGPSQMAPTDVATKTDASKLAESEFLRVDLNVDGMIDKSEFARFVSETAKAASAPSADAASVDAAFKKIATGDEQITLEELSKSRAKFFDAADENRDLALDASERTKFAALVSVRAPDAAKSD